MTNRRTFLRRAATAVLSVVAAVYAPLLSGSLVCDRVLRRPDWRQVLAEIERMFWLSAEDCPGFGLDYWLE